MLYICTYLNILILSISGMTIEVLGTVIGTAIQGQIVGGANAPCLNHTSLNDSKNNLSSDVNSTHISLSDTVRVGGAIKHDGHVSICIMFVILMCYFNTAWPFIVLLLPII